MKKDNIILALDQSTTATGWSLFKSGELVDYGAYKPRGDRDKRIEQMRKWLIRKVEELSLDSNVEIALVLEDIQMQINVETFKSLAQLQGVLINTGFQLHEQEKISDTSIYFASEWKKTCGVKGRKSAEQKANAQKFILRTYDIDVSQDTCDAICLGYHHVKEKNSVINFE